MEIKEYFNLIKAKKQTIISIVVFFLLISVIINALQSFKFSADTQILIVQNFEVNVDPYGIARSNQYLSSKFVELIKTNSFFEELLESNTKIDGSYFGNNQEKRYENWQKTVKVKEVNDTGIINIKVLHSDKDQARIISETIGLFLIANHNNYDGRGDLVKIKVINKPLVSAWPVKPNIVLNIILGLLLSFIISLAYIYVFPEEKYNLRLIAKKNKVNKNILEIKEEKNISNKKDDTGSKSDCSTNDNDDLDYTDIIKQGNIRNVLNF